MNYLGLSSSWGCKIENNISSSICFSWVLMKCLAAVISSTVITHGWLSNCPVTFTFFTLEPNVDWIHGNNESSCNWLKLSVPTKHFVKN